MASPAISMTQPAGCGFSAGQSIPQLDAQNCRTTFRAALLSQSESVNTGTLLVVITAAT
jgi:hypothetical protein